MLPATEFLLIVCCVALFNVRNSDDRQSAFLQSKAYLSFMKKLLTFLVFTCLFFHVNAQTAEDSVKAVINQLFTAMKNADAASLKDCFADSAILQTITSNGQIRNEEVAEFAKQVASLPKGDADERIRFDLVRADDGLAIAWTPYQFYYKGAFSHCGVDSYQLVRLNGHWKIQYLIDTRRKQNCQ